jgi:hypothetical protein
MSAASPIRLSAELARLPPVAKAQRRAARYRALYGSRRWSPCRRAWPTTCTASIRHRAKRIRTIANPFDFAAIRTLAAEPCPARPAEPYILHVGRFARKSATTCCSPPSPHSAMSQRLVLLTPPDACASMR